MTSFLHSFQPFSFLALQPFPGPPCFATLPDLGYLLAGCVLVALVALIGIGAIVSFGRKLVTDLSTVVKNEIAAQREAAPVSVQQPLIVKAHQDVVSLEQHEELREQFSGLLEQRRKDVSTLHAKVEQGLREVRQDIAAEFKEVRETQVTAREEIAVLKTETASQTRQLHALDNKIENLPEKIVGLLDHHS